MTGNSVTSSSNKRLIMLGATLSVAGALEAGTGGFARQAGHMCHMAFHGSGCVSHRRTALAHEGGAATCRRTRLFSLSESFDKFSLSSRPDRSRADADVGEQPDRGLSEEEIHVKEVPINPLKYKGVAKPEGNRALWTAHLSHLDGLSALFSLACGSATLACMGILEWSTLATLGVFVGYFSTAVGSVMVLATAVVGVLALVDTVRTSSKKFEEQEEEALQALAAPPRRLGSMGKKS